MQMAFMNKKTYEIKYIKEKAISSYSVGNYFHVDDLLAPALQALNRKYYFTAMCCAGEHKLRVDGIRQDLYGSENYCWILFEQGIVLPSLPPGFYKEPPPFLRIAIDSVCISRACDARHNESLNQLYLWALSLPDFKNG
jgi:hypothetical protein